MNYIFKLQGRRVKHSEYLLRIILVLIIGLFNSAFPAIQSRARNPAVFDQSFYHKTFPRGADNAVNLSLPLKICEIYQNNDIKYMYASDNVEQLELLKPANNVKPAKVEPANVKPANVKPANVKPAGNLVFFVLDKSKIMAFDLQKNQLLWTTELGGKIASGLLVDDEKLIVITALDKTADENANDNFIYYKIWILDRNTGITIRQDAFNLKSLEYFTISSFPDFFLISDSKADLIKINKNSGSKDNLENLENSASRFISPDNFDSPPVILTGKIYIAARKNSILVLSAETNDFFKLLQPLPYAATILKPYKNFLLAGDQKGWVSLYDPARGKIIWRRRYGGEISGIAIEGNSILITSLDNFAYLISSNKGKTLWKKRLSSRIILKPVIVGDFLLLIADSGSNVFVLDIGSGKVINQISMPDNEAISQTPVYLGNRLLIPAGKKLYEVVNQNQKCL